jgi:hypothetical protein
MKGVFVAAVVVTMPIAAGSQLQVPNPWKEADRATIRLDPRQFTELPRRFKPNCGGGAVRFRNRSGTGPGRT